MFNRILLALDMNASNELAVTFTVALARERAASVRVVHVCELDAPMGKAVETELEAIDIVDFALATLRSLGVEADGVHYMAYRYAVPHCIAQMAREWSADAIVFGSMRSRRWPRFPRASVRERVTLATALPVFVAPAPLDVPSCVDFGDAIAGPVEAAPLKGATSRVSWPSSRSVLRKLRRRRYEAKVEMHPFC